MARTNAASMMLSWSKGATTLRFLRLDNADWTPAAHALCLHAAPAPVVCKEPVLRISRCRIEAQQRFERCTSILGFQHCDRPVEIGHALHV